MRFIPLVMVSLAVGASVWACGGGDDGSDPSNTGGEGGTTGDGDGDGDATTNPGDGDPGDGDGDNQGNGDGDGDGTGDGDDDECTADVTRCTDDDSQVDVCVDGSWETRECSSSIPLCVDDRCDPENCEGCLLDGSCYSDGASDPNNGCQVCDADDNDWVFAAEGTSCGDHGTCDAGACACAEGWAGADCGTCVVYVKTDGDDEESGASWNEAVGSLQVALDLAAARLVAADMDKCEVWVAEGTYKPGTEITSTFQLRQGVGLYGGFAGNETAIADRDWGEHETILSGDLAGDDALGDLDNPASPLHRDDNVYHVVTGANDAPLDGLIIRGGGNSEVEDPEDQHGSGLLNLNVTPTVRNCLFEDNYAGLDGTAIYTEGSDSIGTISQSTFERNVSAAGSTVYFGTSEANLEQVLMRDNVNARGALTALTAVVSVKEAQFVTNEAENGAAIYAAEDSELVVQGAVFDANISAGNGGAVWLLGSTTIISGATFGNNSAADLSQQDVRGGALIAVEGDTWIANCGFYNNSAQGDDADHGGAIENGGGSQMSIFNSSFVGNSALAGSAVGNDHEDSTLAVINSSFFGNSSSGTNGTLSNLSGTVDVSNSIFWDGGSPVIATASSPDAETNVTFSDVEGGYTGEGNVDVDPEFVDAADADLHLTSDSPLIDQGDNASLPEDLLDLDGDGDLDEALSIDLDGNDRVVGSSVDMGAYERQ